jgi:hypothetical protein
VKHRPVEFTAHYYPVEILFVPSARAWRRLLRELDRDDPYLSAQEEGKVTMFTSEGNNPKVVVTFGQRCEGYDRLTVLEYMAHECVHVVQFVEETIKSRLSDECEAYFVQALFRWLAGAYNDSGRRCRQGEL